MEPIAKLEAAVARAFGLHMEGVEPNLLDLIAATRGMLGDSAYSTEMIIAAILKFAKTQDIGLRDD